MVGWTGHGWEGAGWMLLVQQSSGCRRKPSTAECGCTSMHNRALIAAALPSRDCRLVRVQVNDVRIVVDANLHIQLTEGRSVLLCCLRRRCKSLMGASW